MPNWCPGCGDFGIWGALKQALDKKGWQPTDFCLSLGIGCHGHMVNFLKSYAIETLHGRPIPVAQGIRLANHKLPVIIVAGDGDTFGEGTNHLVHIARRNVNATMLVHDNQIYGLTTGQTSPTSAKGFKSKSTPAGVLEDPVNPIAITLAAGATFVARGFAGDIPALSKLILQAFNHNGFAFVDIFQPCVTFNHVNTYQWYREHIYELDSIHDITNRSAALVKSQEWGPKIPVGIFYKEEKPSYEDQTPQIAEKPLIEKSPMHKNLAELLEEFV
ncbi:2-oxoacid ferredoxin oxidoreductase [Candidatus Microgenomates bacterium]|nr:MAG: 2-oxoacid ferredoxin oxidoreductase [Candidatus Microgenomates bacterium]